MDLAGDTKAVLLAAGLIFLLALGLGVWKYRQMASSESHLAHPYVDTAHRAALLYSFATLLVAAFVQFSGFSELVDLLVAGVLVFFFVAAVAGYAYHGWRQDTDNQFRDPAPSAEAVHGFIGGADRWRDRGLRGPARGLRGGTAALARVAVPGRRARYLSWVDGTSPV